MQLLVMDGHGVLQQDTTIILKRESERLAGEAEVVKNQVRRVDQVLTRVTQAQDAGQCSHTWVFFFVPFSASSLHMKMIWSGKDKTSLLCPNCLEHLLVSSLRV